MKVLPAREGNAGTVAAFSRDLRRLIFSAQKEYKRAILLRAKQGNTAPIMAADAQSWWADWLGRAGAWILSKIQNSVRAMAVKYVTRGAKQAVATRVKDLKAAGVPEARIRLSATNQERRIAIPSNSWEDRTAENVTAENQSGYNDPTDPVRWRQGGRVYANQLLIKNPYLSDRAAAEMANLINSQTELITNLCAESLSTIRRSVANMAPDGVNTSDLEAVLLGLPEFDAGRASRVAIDQVNKIQQGVIRANDAEMGITQGIWVHVPGQWTSRESHIQMSGKKFELDQGIYDPDVRKYVHCAELPYCRCIYRAVIPEDLLS